MKRVLFFIDSLGQGGAEKVLVNLLNNIDRNRYDITLLTIFGGGVNEKYLSPDINRRAIFQKAFRGNVMLFKCVPRKWLYKLFVKEHYDVAVAFLEGNTTRIISGCPYLDTKKLAWIHVEMSKNGFDRLFRSEKETIKIYSSFDKIIGVSKTVLDSFVENTKQWNTLEVKYNVVDSDYIRECSDEDAADVKMDKKAFNMISIGRLIEQKSYKRLISIQRRLREAGYNTNLYILGEGEQRKELEALIRAYNIDDSVFLLGFRDNPWKYVKNADLFVCSSWKEGFSTAVSETLIVGTPVVTTRCSGMDEMLGDNEYGLIVDNDETALYEGIKKMIDDKDMLEHYRAKAKERGRWFDKKKTVRAVEELLDEM